MYRIVHNEQTDTYRVEKSGLLDWAFVNDPQTGDYLGFGDPDDARRWVRNHSRHDDQSTRRWKVISDCSY